jgi:hypothetical protein
MSQIQATYWASKSGLAPGGSSLYFSRTCAGQRTLPHNLRKERLVRLEGLRQLFTGEILQVRCFRNIKPSRIVGLPTHEEVEYQKPPARVSPESPIVVTHHMAGIVVHVGISGSRYVDIAHVLSEVELIDLSNLMSDYSFLICTQRVPNIDSQSLY